MFSFPGMNMTETVEESKMLNMDNVPKVIISASGMCDAGRIRHHLKHNLWKENSAVVFVGFQSPGTLGRHLLDGAEKVKMFGEEIAVRAKIINFQGLSSHADRDHLMDWIGKFKAPKPQHVFIVHGDSDVAPLFAETVQDMGFAAHAPLYTEEYDLITATKVAEGYTPEKKKATFVAEKTSDAFKLLQQAMDSLTALVRRSKGRDNKTLNAFTEAVRGLVEKFKF